MKGIVGPSVYSSRRAPHKAGDPSQISRGQAVALTQLGGMDYILMLGDATLCIAEAYHARCPDTLSYRVRECVPNAAAAPSRASWP